jgi:peptidylprolyl isomerase
MGRSAAFLVPFPARNPGVRLLLLVVYGVVYSIVCYGVAACGVAADGVVPLVTGVVGSRPVVAIPHGLPGCVPRVTVLSTGGGPPTMPGDVVMADVEARRWSGNRLYLSTYDTGRPVRVLLGGRHVPGTGREALGGGHMSDSSGEALGGGHMSDSSGEAFGGRGVSDVWREALVGRPAGSRVVLVGPADRVRGPGLPLDGVDPSDTMVLVFDILGGYPPDARLVGRAVPDVPAGLSPLMPARELIGGSGPQVRVGSKIVVQYVAVEWPGGKVVDSSHQRGGPVAYTLKEGAVPPGWLRGLAGHSVGSRVGFAAGSMAYVVDVVDVIDVVDVVDAIS